MLHPDRVIASVARALVPHGRFVGELGGDGNVRSIFAALRESLDRRGLDAQGRFPWYFPPASEYAEKLRAGGFTVERIEQFERPTPLPTGMAAWLETFAQPFFHGMEPKERAAVVAEATERLAETQRDADGRWVADYVRVRFIARKT